MLNRIFLEQVTIVDDFINAERVPSSIYEITQCRKLKLCATNAPFCLSWGSGGCERGGGGATTQGASQSSSPYNEAWKTSEARAAQAFTKTPSHPIFSWFSSNSSEQKQNQRHQIQNETLKCFGFRPCVGNHSSDIDTRGKYLFEERICRRKKIRMTTIQTTNHFASGTHCI